MTLEKIFNMKRTENGDLSFSSTTNHLLDLMFMSEYYQNHLKEVQIGTSEKEKLFSMFMRDPRYGMGRRELGRILMLESGVSPEQVVKAGRFDDLFIGWESMSDDVFALMCNFLYKEIIQGNELCKKWMPRYSSKNLMLARKIAKFWGMNKQQYGHFIKCNTVENKLSRKNIDDIIFSQVPSLALVKYFTRFKNGEDTKSRFNEYLENVRSGKENMKISTTTVYDIYRNRNKIDADLFFDKIEKIKINCLVCLDSSGSMQDENDSYGKALSIGHYLTKCSTYKPGMFISFSSHPQLMKLTTEDSYSFKQYSWRGNYYGNETITLSGTPYNREIHSMYTGDCSNTDFGAVCELLKNLDKDNAPEWLIVLTDMEFDEGSKQSKDEMISLFRQYGISTKLVWWNFNSRNTTTIETSDEGNIFMSGYSPMLLKYLEAGFNGEQFLDKLLEEYKKKIS